MVELETFEISSRVLTVDGSALPRAGVTWLEAVALANDRSAKDGLEAAYRIAGAQVEWNPRSTGWRLPTEAEWVSAASAGAATPTGDRLREFAWTALDRVDGPQPVATKRANALGLFDALGNVWE